MIFILSGVSHLTSQNYAGTIYIYTDFNGDGTYDVVEHFSDSIKIYDGVSSTLLARYTPDGTFVPTSVAKLRYNRVAVKYSSGGGDWKFKVYENLSNLLYTSPAFTQYPSTYTDPNNDGTIDITIRFQDSIVVYDGAANSLTKMHTYVADPGYSTSFHFSIPGGVMVIGMRTPSDMKFKVYENVSNLVYTSPDHSFSFYAYAYAMDYDSDGRFDIVVRTDPAGNERIVVYSTPYVSVDEAPSERDSKPTSTLIKDGYLNLAKPSNGNTTVEIYDMTGRLRMRAKVPSGESRVYIPLPPGIYTYKVKDEKSTTTAKLINLR